MIDLTSYGKIMSFEVHPVSILGDIYKKVKVLSIVDYDTAKLFSDVNAIAVSVYPMLPTGTAKDFTKYRYVKIQHQDGTISVVAMEWINMRTVEEHLSVEINVRVQATGIDTQERLRACLEANNFVIKEITVL